MNLPSDILDSVTAMKPWVLAEAAECGVPDSPESAGSIFLESVKSATMEAIGEMDIDDMSSLSERMSDAISEVADNAPDVGTYQRWAEFVDLAAFQEDLTEFGPTVSTDDITTSVAGVALHMIAQRAAAWLVDYVGTEYATLAEAAIGSAATRGADDGRNAAAWWAQENIGGRSTGDASEVARRVLAGLDDGDPEILDTLPAADFSGQWADGMTADDLLGGLAGTDVATDDTRTEVMDAYEDAYGTAVQEAVGAACAAVLSTDQD